MKPFMFTTRLVLVITAIWSFQSIGSQTMTFMTYNIRYDSPNDGENRWAFRKSFLARQIMFHSPDIFGIQEGLHHQVTYLDTMLSGYAYVGVGRADGQTSGEYSAIFYKPAVFKIISQKTFWLSETPDSVSVGWDAAMERICTYALFKHQPTGTNIWVFNTHLDHRGDLARKNSVDLILKTIEEANQKEYPVIFMGDFNLEPNHESIGQLKRLMNDGYDLSTNVHVGPDGTYNGFNYCKPVTRRIDYVFTSKDLEVEKYAVLSDSWDLKYPSDHLPVFVSVSLLYK